MTWQPCSLKVADVKLLGMNICEDLSETTSTTGGSLRKQSGGWMASDMACCSCMRFSIFWVLSLCTCSLIGLKWITHKMSQQVWVHKHTRILTRLQD